MRPRISVVVPTCRRNDLLDRCLAALARQRLDPALYEVVVADDAPQPETERLVCGWAQRAACPIRYLAVSGTHGPAAARNAGWREARGEAVAFTDDDCVPDPGWLAAGLAALEGADAAWGRIRMPRSRPLTDYHRDAARLEEAGFVTANCFCRREALARIGGFDERFTVAWREDSDLFFNLLKSGCRVVPALEAEVVHPLRPAAWGVSVRQQRKNMFNALLYKKHPRLYRERIQRWPPWRYYLGVAALAAAAAAGLAGFPTAAWAAGGAWFALTARFCAQRLQDTSHAPAHVVEMALTSAAIPPLAVFWRLAGAVKFRVFFL